MIERITPTEKDINALAALWESSVRATHHFLASDDIELYRAMVRGGALAAIDIYAVRDSEGDFAAFAGVDGDKLEMLFVAPDILGNGIGRYLLEYLVNERGVRKVDVNEQNTGAVGFYEHMGFRTVGRDEKDPSGRPYPILHMEC